MLLERIATTSHALAATRSRLAKRALIAGVLREAGPDEIELAVTYLSGSLRQRRTGLGWATLKRLPPPAGAPSLSLSDVDQDFATIAALAGQGSADARTRAASALFARATEPEQTLLRGLIFDEVRQGALDSLVQDGLAEAYAVPAASVRRAAMLLGSTPAAAALLAAGGIAALDSVTLRVGQPVRPMLAASAPDVSAALEKAGLPCVVDGKLDGIRVQIHRDGPTVRVYTRSLDDITDRVPEIVEAVLALPSQRLVLDAEALALRPDGRPHQFQVIASRTASRVDVDAMRRQTPLSLYCFDVLHIDGRDLLDEPLRHRIEMMAQVLPGELVVPRAVAEDADTVAAAFARAVDDGFEGVVLKRLDAPYAAGRRDSGWVKVKPRHTFDLAVIAAEWGHGRRTGKLSNLHLAARDADTGELVMLGETFKGLTDEILAWQTEQMLVRQSRTSPGTVHIDPPLVVEIACDGLQASTRYPGGIALRFARVIGYRDDLEVGDVDTLEAITSLLAPRSDTVAVKR